MSNLADLSGLWQNLARRRYYEFVGIGRNALVYPTLELLNWVPRPQPSRQFSLRDQGVHTGHRVGIVPRVNDLLQMPQRENDLALVTRSSRVATCHTDRHNECGK